MGYIVHGAAKSWTQPKQLSTAATFRKEEFKKEQVNSTEKQKVMGKSWRFSGSVRGNSMARGTGC